MSFISIDIDEGSYSEVLLKHFSNLDCFLNISLNPEIKFDIWGWGINFY